MSHPVLATGQVALVTGAAGGIGLAASKHFASLGMKVCMADLDAGELEGARQEVLAHTSSGAEVIAVPTDVADAAAVLALRTRCLDALGGVQLLMNNAACFDRTRALDAQAWRKILEVNLFGVVLGTQTFVPEMVASGAPGVVVNTGSKQGITTPPGNPAYNVSKAGVKAYTEALQHELRNTEGCQVSAHLLIPGYTNSPRRPRAEAAWEPEQVVGRLCDAIETGAFYVLCPDNEVTLEMDQKRILWAAGDVAHGRPALSRWHPEFAEAFARFQP